MFAYIVNTNRSFKCKFNFIFKNKKILKTLNIKNIIDILLIN